VNSQRFWIDGSYKMGCIGYGVYGRPGEIKLCGGCPGTNAHQAELLAAEQALALVPDGAACILYTDSQPVIAYYAATPSTRVRLTVSYLKVSDPFHRIAHELANRGREQAYRRRSVDQG